MASQLYIITSEPKLELDFLGKSAVKGDKRAIFYCKSIGRRRFYRQSMRNPQKGMALLIFKRKSRAEEVCFVVNNVWKENFKVELWSE